MKVVVYEPHYNEKHRTVLRALAAGIPGAIVRDVRDYEPCDVAVIFGLAKKSYPPSWSKRTVLDRHSGRSLIVVESAFVLRGEYWSVGWGGIAGAADFRTGGVTRDRWQAMGVKTRPWQRRTGGPVVVCGQLPRDTNVQNTDHPAWCRAAVAFYQGRGHQVLFRPHPRIDDPAVYGVPAELWDTRKIGITLRDARCVVTYNSTSGTDAALAGVPVVACDPSSFAWPVASHGLVPIDELRYPSRRGWLAGLGYSQWTLDEMRSGLPWRHLSR